MGVWPWPFMRNALIIIILIQRIDRIKSTLTSDLETHFASILNSLVSNDKTKTEKAKQPEAERTKLVSDLTDCLRAYDMLGLWLDAEDVIRRELVREFAKKVSSVMSFFATSLQAISLDYFSRLPLWPSIPFDAIYTLPTIILQWWTEECITSSANTLHPVHCFPFQTRLFLLSSY